MEGTPEYLDYAEIMDTFLQIPGVVRVRKKSHLLPNSYTDNYFL